MRILGALLSLSLIGTSNGGAFNPPTSRPTAEPSSSNPSGFPTAVPSSSVPTAVPSSSVPTVVPSSSAPSVIPSTSTPSVIPSTNTPTSVQTVPSQSQPPTSDPTNSSQENEQNSYGIYYLVLAVLGSLLFIATCIYFYNKLGKPDETENNDGSALTPEGNTDAQAVEIELGDVGDNRSTHSNNTIYSMDSSDDENKLVVAEAIGACHVSADHVSTLNEQLVPAQRIED